jgi:hypothetical protein
MLLRLLTITICLFLVSCSVSRFIQTDLYFGQSKPNGSMVTEEEWTHFKQDQITRVFKEGSTTVKVVGNWYDPIGKKLISEPTYIVTYYYQRSPKISKQIDSLRNLYKDLFQQQSILRVDKKVNVRF